MHLENLLWIWFGLGVASLVFEFMKSVTNKAPFNGTQCLLTWAYTAFGAAVMWGRTQWK